MSRKEWTKIFKGLANENRLKIIKLLYPDRKMTVSEIQGKIGISFKWTSVNLNNLGRIGILESEGSKDHVLHYLNPQIPKGVYKIIQEFLSASN